MCASLDYLKKIKDFLYSHKDILLHEPFCRACLEPLKFQAFLTYYMWIDVKYNAVYYFHNDDSRNCYSLRWKVFIYKKQVKSGYFNEEALRWNMPYFQDIESFNNYEKTTPNKL